MTKVTKIKKNTSIWMDARTKDVIWYKNEKGKLKIDDRQMYDLLSRNGFTILRDTSDRRSGYDLIQIEKGMIKSHDEDSMRKFIFEFYDSLPSEWWDDENKFGKSGKSKLQVMRIIFNLYISKSKLGYHLKSVFDKTSKTYKTLPLLEDKSKEAFIPFKNGVVHITPNEMKLIPYEDDKVTGVVWESQIIRRNIELISNTKRIMDGKFAYFCRKATSKKVKSVTQVNDWIDAYEENTDVLKSLMTSYGYLIHNHKSPSQPVAPVYMDGDAEIGMENGRNGKSFVMGSIEEWKKVAYQSGKSYAISSKGNFQWNNVQIDTKFVYLNDMPSSFNIEDLYDRLSDDFEVRPLYKNKFIIPKDKSPKMGITTNYPIKTKGGSGRHRIHITPFSSYWLTCRDMGEMTTDERHLGKEILKSDYKQSEWNEFYNFGFICLQSYLQNGLHHCDTSEQTLKSIIAKWEGDTNDGVVEWWIDIVESKKIPQLSSLADRGVDRMKLFEMFHKIDFKDELHIKTKWLDSHKFFQMIYGVSIDMGYEYNPHKSNMGEGMNKRKYLVRGKDGKNHHHIIIQNPKKQ